jgi:hypothetical protein
MKPSEKLIQTIKEKRIKPAPKWRFKVRNALLWTSYALAVLLGALAFSIILFSIQQTDFNVITHLSHSRLELFLGLLPLFWIVWLIICLIIAIYSVQYSNRGYKLTLPRIVAYSSLLSALVGTLFFISGGAHQLEHAFAINILPYDSIQEKKIRVWTMPEEGYLCGKIEQVTPENLQLEDFEGRHWTILYNEAFMPPAVMLVKGEIIKIVGEKTKEGRFVAAEIRPWGGGQMRGRGRTRQ